MGDRKRDHKRRPFFQYNAALYIAGALIIIAGVVLIFEAGIARMHS